jgi:site-specific recombinase XerD
MYGKPKNYQLSESKIITEPELKKLLKELSIQKEVSIESGKQLHYINDYYLVLIGSLTGLRISEMSGLQLEMIYQDNIEVVGKGNRKRLVPIGTKCRKALDDFIDLKSKLLTHPTKLNDHLFISIQKRPFTRYGINRRLYYWCRRSSIKAYSYHSLRHRFATFCLNNGFNLIEVQKFLGHSSPTTTSMYLHFTSETKDKVDKVL